MRTDTSRAAAKSVAGIGIPLSMKAHNTPKRVFLCAAQYYPATSVMAAGQELLRGRRFPLCPV